MEVKVADISGARMKKFEGRIKGLQRSSRGITISDMQVGRKTD
jgi:hypothetical protein